MPARFIVLFCCLGLANIIPAYGHGTAYLPPSGYHTGLNVVTGPGSHGVSPIYIDGHAVNYLPIAHRNPIMHHSRHPAALVTAVHTPIGHSHVHHRRNCRANIHCSNSVADITYTTDGQYCYKFNNSCHLAYANCERRNAMNSLLKPISRHDCHRLPRSSIPY